MAHDAPATVIDAAHGHGDDLGAAGLGHLRDKIVRAVLACADEEDVTITAGNEDIGLSNEFRFTLILGPAARYVFSPSFDAYAGIGFKIEEHIITVDDPSSAYKSTSYGTQLAVDCDMGVKFNMENNTSVRIGIYSTFEVLSYNYMINSRDGKEDYTTSDIRLNIIASGDARQPLSAVGYISLGKTFSSSNVETVYRYEITSREPGKGQLSVVTR